MNYMADFRNRAGRGMTDEQERTNAPLANARGGGNRGNAERSGGNAAAAPTIFEQGQSFDLPGLATHDLNLDLILLSVTVDEEATENPQGIDAPSAMAPPAGRDRLSVARQVVRVF